MAWGLLPLLFAADRFGIETAIWIVAYLTFFSGVLVAIRMKETLSRASR